MKKLSQKQLSILNDVNKTTLKFFDYAIMYVIALVNNYKRITLFKYI